MTVINSLIILALLIIGCVGLIKVFAWTLFKKSKGDDLKSEDIYGLGMVKKYSYADIHRNRRYILITAMLIGLFATKVIVDMVMSDGMEIAEKENTENQIRNEVIELPNIDFDTPEPEPEPPKPKKIKVIKIVEEKVKEEDPEDKSDLDDETFSFGDEEEVVFVEPKPEVIAPTIHMKTDKDALPPGGSDAFTMAVDQKVESLAKSCGQSGMIALFFVVDDKGKVQDMEKKKGICDDLDKAVMNLVRGVTWTPAEIAGKPVYQKCKFLYRVQFN